MEKTLANRTFYCWLCRSYRRTSALSYFVTRRVTPLAWLVAGLLSLSVLMGINLTESITVLFSSLLFSTLSIGFLWAFLRRAEVAISRQIPETGVVGEEMDYSVTVTNEGGVTLRGFHLKDSGDDPRPTEWEFIHLKEPDEALRNPFDRFFAYYRWKWLMERGGKWRSLGRSEALDLPAGESVSTRLTLLPNRRGVLELEDMRVVLPDPFGFFQRFRNTKGGKDEVLVLPRRYRLPELHLVGKSELKVGGETASDIRGEGGEFLGLREYHQGDSLRKVDWKAWARTGEPIVREFEEARFPRYGLILDSSLDDSGPELFEEAVSVAASFVSTMDRQSCLLDLMFVRDSPVVFTAGRGVARAEELMEVLARVEGSEGSDYDPLSKLVLRYAAEMTACVIVLSGWNEARRDFVQNLRRSGLKVHLYVIGVGEAPEDAAGALWLRWDQVEKDLLTAS